MRRGGDRRETFHADRRMSLLKPLLDIADFAVHESDLQVFVHVDRLRPALALRAGSPKAAVTWSMVWPSPTVGASAAPAEAFTAPPVSPAASFSARSASATAG